jgi:orotate phosphoribosyltransferase
MSRSNGYANGQAHDARPLIEVLLRSGALLTGDFELKSGKRSPYFVDFGRIPDGDSLDAVGRCYAELIVKEFEPDSYDLLFGPAYKAIPLAVATTMALTKEHGINKSYAFNRKVEKTYGEKSRFLGGDLSRGVRVLIVDDVITDGGTKFETIQLLKSETVVNIVGVVVGVDRSEDPEVIAHFERETGSPLRSLCTIGNIDAVVGAGAAV